jgi:glycine cleavage system H protein
VEHRDGRVIEYRRAKFVTRLPTAYRYSPAHYWLGPQPDGSWRVGLTKFGTRMLGEMVDFGFQTEPGATVHSGQILGWIEGFKAVADVICVFIGEFVGPNPALETDPSLVNSDPYGAGWLYCVRGQPDATCTDVNGYAAVLDQTIDRLLQDSKPE